jgi:hypothetical protein
VKYELKVFGRSLGEDRDDVSPSKADGQKRGKDEALFFFIFMFHFQSLPKDTFSNTLKALKFIALSGGIVQTNEYGSPIHCYQQSLSKVTYTTFALVTLTPFE